MAVRTNKTAEIRDDLRARILNGEFEPGAQLPSLSELTRLYGASSRSAPTRALEDLVDEGLLTMRHGKGAFVRNRPVVPRDLAANLRLEYQNAMKDQEVVGGLFETMTGTEAKVVATYDWIAADERVAGKLDLAVGDEVLLRTYEYSVGGEPHQIARSYLPAWIARRAGLRNQGDERPGVGSIAHLRAAGVTVDRGRLGIEARMPTAEESQQLAISRGQPVYETSRVLFRACEPVELMTSIIPGDQVAYYFDIDLKEQS